jgi:excisionase family DNA binding protein
MAFDEVKGERLLFGVRDAAASLSVSDRMLWALIAAGEIKVRHIGTRTLVHRRELERFANRDHQSPLGKKSA